MIYSPWPIPGQLSLFWPHSPSVGASRSPSANPASVEPRNGDFLPITEGMAQLRAGQLPKDLFFVDARCQKIFGCKAKHPKTSKIIQNSVILGAARRSSDRNYMESSVRHHLFESSSHVISNGRCLVLSIWKLRLLFLQLAIHLLAAPQRKQRWSRTCENQCLSRQFKDIFINLHVEKNYRYVMIW